MGKSWHDDMRPVTTWITDDIWEIIDETALKGLQCTGRLSISDQPFNDRFIDAKGKQLPVCCSNEIIVPKIQIAREAERYDFTAFKKAGEEVAGECVKNQIRSIQWSVFRWDVGLMASTALGDAYKFKVVAQSLD